MEEIPGEEAFPAYLDSSIKGVYERAGIIRTNDGSIGSLTWLLWEALRERFWVSRGCWGICGSGWAIKAGNFLNWAVFGKFCFLAA